VLFRDAEVSPMRDNGPITNREVEFPEDTMLVSRTHTGGRITFSAVPSSSLQRAYHMALLGRR
jgi:hypothetical protein